MPRWKRLLIYMLLIALSFGGYNLWKLIHGEYVATSSIEVSRAVRGEGQITVVGQTTIPRVGFRGYDYELKGNILYIRLRYGLIPYQHPLRQFVVNVDVNAQKIHQICLKGKDDEDTKVLWQGEF